MTAYGNDEQPNEWTNVRAKKKYCTQENDLSRYSGNQNEVEKSRRSLVSLCNGYYNNNQK